MKQYYILYTI